MSGQDENPVSDASNTRQILTPVPDPSIFGSDGLAVGGKKRKRDGNTMEDLLRDCFVVKPYPNTGATKLKTLQPLILLPRSQLPLSSLDIASPGNALPPSRLFETHVKILELEERMGSQPMVLIARLDDGRTLYAVEREDRGLYVLCQLGSWVNLKQLRLSATVSKQDLSKPSEKGLDPSRGTVSTPLITPESSKYSKKKRLAIEAIQSMVKRPSTGLMTESQPNEVGQISTLDSTQEQSAPTAPIDESAAQRTSSEIFEMIRNQYFETLYLSKASLAYFAKGPLSRARAAFHLDYDSTLDMNEYISFLESLIMTTALIDKKYKDGVPDCVSLMDLHDHSADDAKRTAEKSKKRKSSKKMKAGKTGLYPLEDMLIRKWWASHDDEADSCAPGISKEEISRNRVSQLRVRETQLQMIVLLEVLALQPLASAAEDFGDGLPTAHPPSSAEDGRDKLVKGKTRGYLTRLIDVHIDRLCIWQSIALESADTPLDSAPKPNVDFNSSTILLKHADNFLRDFCVEVVVPFFSARLPDLCADMSRKLGGPVIVSPPKPKLSKSSSFSASLSRPGATTKRPAPAKPRRSLQRVRTDERDRRSVSHGPNRSISLMRSATMPLLPGLKREGSEAPSLSSIPCVDSQPLHANRGGVLNSKRFTQREIDLSSLAPDANAKSKKQASIEAELKEAISALKKPNRELAGKALAETAEQRSASASHSRKSKKPVRNPLFQGVQISATPKANRKKNVASASKRSSLPKMAEEMDMTVIPPSSLPRVPQSVARTSLERPAGNPLLSVFQATPTRKSLPAQRCASGFLGAGMVDDRCYLPSSPLQQRRSSVQLFSVVPDSAVKSSSFSHGIQETPVKQRTGTVTSHGHPNDGHAENNKENMKVSIDAAGKVSETTKNKGMHEDSIYKSLGWDDGDDIDELA